NGTPKIRLNLKNKSSLDRYADYSSGSQSKTLYFTYTIQDGDFTPQTNPLDVTGFDTSAGHFSFHDPYEIVNIDNEVKVPSDPEARLGGQKNIYVVSGKARVSSATLDKGGRLTVEFAWPENPFSWSLVRGSGDLKLAVRESDYRVPSVITETRYRRLGLEDNNPYYERTINGAFSSGITDTNPKYVLRFDLDTATFGISGNSSSTNEMKNLRHDIRTRETITLSAFASQISLSSHTMTVNLGELLPVRGVRYGLNVDSGFLKDSLAGIDLDAMAEEMVYPGVEKPFFRVEKKDEEYDSGKRQAKQPAVARVKLDSRTPDAEIQYTDPGHPDSYTSDYAENHLLEQVAVDGRWHLAPQPRPEDINAVGNKASLPEPRANKLPALHEPRKNDSRTKKYTGEFTIGNENYAMGGMVYRLAAVAYSKAEPDTPSDPSYEVAYRSVLVFNNTEVEKISSDIGQTVRLDGYNGDSNPSIFSFPGPYRDGRNLRIWLMGGDSVSGFVVTPGFPLAWDANKYHGIRLMTPIGSTGTSGGNYDKYTRIGSHINNNDVTLETNLTYERDVPSSYNTKGTYTWYWITWKLGNAAYVQFQRRAINDSRGSNDPLFDTRYISDLKQGWNDYKEYYPVFPGETRVVNPVTPYWYRDGQIYQYYKILNKRDSSTRWHPIKG
ncbi:MAG: hypothetical protein LBH57_04280, partial [Treponema sp.]|nr:hypothetical protein [Treponema sp.]